MKKIYLKSNMLSIIISIVFIVLGLLLTLFSNMTLSLVAFVIGLFIIIGSFTYLANYLKSKESSFDLACFIIMLVLGLIVIFKYDFFASILPFVIGIVILINSVKRLQLALELKNNNEKWVISLVLALVGLTLGILFIFNPFKGALVITKAIGIYMLVYGVISLIENIMLKKDVMRNVKRIKIIDEK